MNNKKRNKKKKQTQIKECIDLRGKHYNEKIMGRGGENSLYQRKIVQEENDNLTEHNKITNPRFYMYINICAQNNKGTYPYHRPNPFTITTNLPRNFLIIFLHIYCTTNFSVQVQLKFGSQTLTISPWHELPNTQKCITRLQSSTK